MRRFMFAIICLSSLAARAQYIDVQAGFSFASGSFGNSNLSKDNDGFATSGHTIGLQAAYLVSKKIGICARINYNSFGFNTGKYQDQLNSTVSQGTSVMVKSNGDYKSTSALAGPYVTLGNGNFTVDLRLMAGLLSLTNSGLTYATSYSGQEYTQSQESETNTAIAFGWGVTAKYAFPKNIYVSLNLDDVYSNNKFNRNGYNSSNQDKITKPYEAYMLTLGLGYAIQ